MGEHKLVHSRFTQDPALQNASATVINLFLNHAINMVRNFIMFIDSFSVRHTLGLRQFRRNWLRFRSRRSLQHAIGDPSGNLHLEKRSRRLDASLVVKCRQRSCVGWIKSGTAYLN